MIVRRSYHQVKPGKGNFTKALELIKELAARSPHPIRAYTSIAGAEFGALCIEWEVESLAEFEQLTARLGATAEGKAWYERWGEVIVLSAGHAEFWELR